MLAARRSRPARRTGVVPAPGTAPPAAAGRCGRPAAAAGSPAATRPRPSASAHARRALRQPGPVQRPARTRTSGEVGATAHDEPVTAIAADARRGRRPARPRSPRRSATRRPRAETWPSAQRGRGDADAAGADGGPARRTASARRRRRAARIGHPRATAALRPLTDGIRGQQCGAARRPQLACVAGRPRWHVDVAEEPPPRAGRATGRGEEPLRTAIRPRNGAGERSWSGRRPDGHRPARCSSSAASRRRCPQLRRCAARWHVTPARSG